MQKTYGVEVDCGACALKMEEALAKLPGVVSAKIRFMSQKLDLEWEDSLEEKDILQAVRKTCQRVEPDFRLV